MNLGNQLYSALSRLSKQRYLLLEELPTMVTVEDSDYSVEFSQSYTGNLHVSGVNDDVPFVMSLNSALERLQQEMFSLFLLTVEYNTVSIFTDSNGLWKVFDSHARDSFGMPHPHGTCVLLEFDSISYLTGYFKQLYRPGAIFEIKGVKVNYICNEILQNVDTNNDMPYSGSDSDTKINSSSPIIENESMNDNLNYKIAQSYYVFLYAICFSTIKACNYWNDQTQIAIAEHAIELFDKVSNINPLLSTYLPKSTEICGKTFDIVYTSRHEGTLHCISTSSKDALAVVISCNTMNNAGFLICFENSSLACIIQNRKCVKTSKRTKYFLLAADESREVNLFKELPDSRSVVDRLCEYLDLNEPDLEETEYMLQFLSIPCSVTRSEKQKVLRNHKSNEQNEKIQETKKRNNKFMYTLKKKVINETKVIKYKQMDPIKKKVLNQSKLLKSKQIDPMKKKFLMNLKCVNTRKWILFKRMFLAGADPGVIRAIMRLR